jgi:hypothetical protein
MKLWELKLSAKQSNNLGVHRKGQGPGDTGDGIRMERHLPCRTDWPCLQSMPGPIQLQHIIGTGTLAVQCLQYLLGILPTSSYPSLIYGLPGESVQIVAGVPSSVRFNQ